MLFEHLKRAAERSFSDAAEFHAGKPERAMSCAAHGHEALASYYLANDDGRAWVEIRALLEIEIDRYKRFGPAIRSFPQFAYVVLALSIDDVDMARVIAAFPFERTNWSKFDAFVAYRIWEILGVQQTVKEPRLTPTAAEQSFLKALESIALSDSAAPELVDEFWKATRKKRYQLTIFEHHNLFKRALQALLGAS